MINKYKFINNEDSFLIYGEGKIPAKELGLELLESNIDLISRPDEQILPILFINDLLYRTIKKVRTRDKILAEHGIDTFYDLQMAYNLLRNKELNKPVKIRNFVESKYSEIINLEYNPNASVSEEIENNQEIVQENLQE